MNIVHIAPSAPYNDYWGYQENLLPKYHKMLGHNVTLIITNTTNDGGKIVSVPCNDYVLYDGVRVIRLQVKKYLHRALTAMNAKMDVYNLLLELRPDFVFFHGLLSTTIFDVIKYKRKNNSDCVIVQDSHLDYFNHSGAVTFKQKIIRAYYRRINRKSIKHVSRVYGVTPWRKTFAEDYFKVPSEKTDVLIMGADDDKIKLSQKQEIRKSIRDKFGIAEDEFLIVTGGKIDADKKIDVLVDACADMPRVRLLVFGNVCDSFKAAFEEKLKNNDKAIYIGWISADSVYDYFLAADLVCFPGSHSVMWEQACAAKVPCLFKYWDGMLHVNNGGNSEFVDEISPVSLKKKIEELLFTDKYFKMKDVAESSRTDIYLYSNIAKKSLECVEKL